MTGPDQAGMASQAAYPPSRSDTSSKPCVQQHEQVRLGTFYALKTAEAATAAHSRGIPWAIENPEPWEGHISMWLLPGFMALASLPGVQTVNFDQCTIGAETAKPTRVL